MGTATKTQEHILLLSNPVPHVLNLQGNIQDKRMESNAWGSALTLRGAGPGGHPFVPIPSGRRGGRIRSSSLHELNVTRAQLNELE